MGLLGNGDETSKLDYEPRGAFVTPKRVGKMGGVLILSDRGDRISGAGKSPDCGRIFRFNPYATLSDSIRDGEEVQYMTAGSTIGVEGAGSGTSLFGDDRSRKSGTRGYVRAVFTDERVAVKIPQWTGSDERTVPYWNVVGVDLDTGLVKKRISIQTAGPTYHIEMDQPGKEECRNLVRFVRDRAEEVQHDEGANNDATDPTEQLQRLKELHDDGVITDTEYEEKRTNLLDEI